MLGLSRPRSVALAVALVAASFTVRASAAPPEGWASTFADRSNGTYLWLNTIAGGADEGRFLVAVDGAGLFWGTQAASIANGAGGTVARLLGEPVPTVALGGALFFSKSAHAQSVVATPCGPLVTDGYALDRANWDYAVATNPACTRFQWEAQDAINTYGIAGLWGTVKRWNGGGRSSSLPSSPNRRS